MDNPFQTQIDILLQNNPNQIGNSLIDYLSDNFIPFPYTQTQIDTIQQFLNDLITTLPNQTPKNTRVQ